MEEENSLILGKPIPEEVFIFGERSPDIAKLAEALAKAQGELAHPKQGGYNPHFKSRFTRLVDAVDVAKPILPKHGLSVAQIGGRGSESGKLITILLHSSGQWISGSMPIIIERSGPQSQGSGVTYARRYGYLAILGLVPEEDDDGNAGTKNTRNTQNKGPLSKTKAAIGLPTTQNNPLKAFHTLCTNRKWNRAQVQDLIHSQLDTTSSKEWTPDQLTWAGNLVRKYTPEAYADILLKQSEDAANG